jgi:hypothetical protein
VATLLVREADGSVVAVGCPYDGASAVRKERIR